MHGGWPMAVYFQKSHSNFFRNGRTPPFPQIDGPEKILKLKSHDKESLQGLFTDEI
jgi:hypothetical protein